MTHVLQVLTWCAPISKLGLAGPGQLEEREQVTGVPVPVQVGVQPSLLAPRGVPRAVLEAQLILHLQGACHRSGVGGTDGRGTWVTPEWGICAHLPSLTWRGSGAELCRKRCRNTTAASTLPDRLSSLMYSSKSRSEGKPWAVE